ncbi:ABC transporter ATP-binding protein [Liquorilactobacillus satsumensis]|uniref:ABC transporter, ATP-binding protein n=1 Tax=Liquorilactobacillus satsumensis DSM 16230 = JCM 12392 TaxID=1423801 RepID=A0A0R1UUT0_9LACO|nr:ABC transporter ATP-binding protein [Liquorilactobacillus satsumensis]KRL96925.1 ABC transporter, ATP-binding protein [Liquorilactobacillus satsumensis DSM 16230 = JCM 12392]MCC7667814.1 ABC transporter ATP-binding protein [Liquorilactobacillus satsumensis]MCP9329022.1 ABC transporter ATP-binding protein [Liquorilactobacillus satsumensis]MCP9358554.1 ABC transporter ATP-binding protein [Liquorilactobacillus satsumensis]MCP9372490.1 ABC transporter ATP-binding protein [Liquorilactobacillus s
MGIEVKNIKKRFGKHEVLRGINLEFVPGKIYGLLGRNGAGKSTLLNIIAARIFPTAGTVTLDGKTVCDDDSALEQIYLMSERNLYPEGERLKKLLKTTELLYGSFDYTYANKLAAEFSLDLNQKFGKLSTGYRSIFKLIVALCVPARYVFLDEPDLGLDANHRELFYRELMENYAQTHRTFIVSTHLIGEFANLLERVFIIKNGQILVAGEVEDVLAKAYLIAGPKEDVCKYSAGLNVIGHESLGNIYGNYVFGGVDDERHLPDTVSLEHLDLQKLFINLTNEKGEK